MNTEKVIKHFILNNGSNHLRVSKAAKYQGGFDVVELLGNNNIKFHQHFNTKEDAKLYVEKTKNPQKYSRYIYID